MFKFDVSKRPTAQEYYNLYKKCSLIIYLTSSFFPSLYFLVYDLCRIPVINTLIKNTNVSLEHSISGNNPVSDNCLITKNKKYIIMHLKNRIQKRR